MPCHKSRKFGILELSVALTLIIVSGYIILTHSEKLKALSEFGYAGAFIIAFISSSTVILPAPGLFIVGMLSTALNPVLLGIFGGFGSALGEMTGYMSGEGLTGIFFNENINKWRKTAKNLLNKYGPLAIIFFSSFPNPLFDVIGIAAGTLKMPKRVFFLSVLIGNIIKYSIVAFGFTFFLP